MNTDKKFMLLNVRNCHRVAKVRLVADPESGEWEWRYREVGSKGRMDEGSSIAVSKDGREREVRHYDTSLNEWEVTELAYERNFEDLFTEGIAAFYINSHDPESRALYFIRHYEKMYNENILHIPDSEHDRYFRKFRTKVKDLLFKHSRLTISEVTAARRSPSDYDVALNDFRKWREFELDWWKRKMRPDGFLRWKAFPSWD